MVCPSAHRLGSRGTGLYRGQVEKTKERQRLRLLGTGWWTLFRAPVYGLVTFQGPREKLLQASTGEEKYQVPGTRVGLLIIQLALLTGNLETGWA